MADAIPHPNAEPALNMISKDTNFMCFINNNFGASRDFDSMFSFLHDHYFPRVWWAQLSLSPKKLDFFSKCIQMLGYNTSSQGIWPSVDKLAAFWDWPTLKNCQDIKKFCYMLPFLKNFILGRADLTKIMKQSIKEQINSVTFRGRKWNKKVEVGFKWGLDQEKAFQAAKTSILENCCTGSDLKKQWHLSTDALNTGLGGVLFQLSIAPPKTVMAEKLKEQIKIVIFLSFQLIPAKT